MTHSRLRLMALCMAIMAIFLAACAPATPTATPRPTNTAAAPTEEATEEVVAATAEAAAPTEEAAATAEPTEEPTVVAVEPTAVPTEEAAAPTEEVAATAEPTEEAAATAEPTEEAAATAEPTTAPTEEAAATEEPPPPTSYTGAFSFSFPEGWTLSDTSSDALVRISKGDELINFYGPAAYDTVIASQTFGSDQAALEFFLTRTGLTVSDAAEGDALEGELAKTGVALPRRSQAGTAYLLDLDNNRKGVAVWLAPEGSEPSADAVAALEAVVTSVVYPADLVDVITDTADLSTLLAAAQAAGVDLRGGTFTVFAPTNEAFEAALTTLGMTQEELLANPEFLAAILNYHVVEGAMTAADLAAGDVATLNGENVTIAKEGDTVTVNGATVTTADVTASNGVIHIIDQVLVPAELPALPTEEPPAPTEEAAATAEPTAEATEESAAAPAGTIVEIAVGNSDFSTLVAAAQAAGLVETLSGTGPYTVFAPTNEAFAAALESMNVTAEDLLANTEMLTQVLSYHVVPGKLMAADLAAGELETVEGSPVTIAVDGSTVMVNDATVTTADIEASNGVIHVIDKVLMPAAAQSAAPTEEAAAAPTEEMAAATPAPAGGGVTVTINAGEPVRIGLAAAFSGEGLAPFGIDIRRGVELALEDKPTVTVGGTEFTVELDAQDDLCSPEGGQAVANRFVSDPTIVGVIGPMCSSGATAALPIFDAAGYTTINPSATALSLTDGSNTSFNRTVSSDRTQGRAAAEFIYNDLNVRKIAILDDGSAYGKGLADLVEARFVELGGEVAHRDAVTVGETDFRALLEDIAAQEPELLYFGGFNAEAARLITQREDVGLEDTIFMGADGMYGPELIELAGDAAEGVYASAASPISSDAITAFRERYVETYNEEPPSAFNTNSYDAANIFLAAIEATGTLDADGNLVIDRQALSDYVRNLADYQGLSGVMNCAGTGECATTDVAFYQVTDGAYVSLKVVSGSGE